MAWADTCSSALYDKKFSVIECVDPSSLDRFDFYNTIA